MAVSKKEDYKTKYTRIFRLYAEKYDIESLSSPNDKANLDLLIGNTIAIEQLQQRFSDKIDNEDIIPSELAKYNETISNLATINIKLENQLAIDRKSRKKEQEDNPAQFLAKLRVAARDFLNDPDRLVKLYCKHCNIMIGRVSGVYDTTEYECRFLCPQCNKFTKVNRKGRDIFFDLKAGDRDWRRKYPIEVEHPKSDRTDLSAIEDDIIIEVDAGVDIITEDLLEED